MNIVKFLPAAALMVLPFAAPMSVYAADSTTTTPAKPQTATNGLSVAGDVALSGICQVEGQFQVGQMMIFRAQVLETNGTAIAATTGVTVTATLSNGATVTMAAHGPGLWVGTYVIPANTPLGPLLYTMTAKDAAGNTGTFVPLGIPPMIVNNTVSIAINNRPIASFQEIGASVPLFPIIQLLKSEGMKVGWDGHTVTVTSSNFPAALPPATGSGPYSVVINGKTVFKTTGQVMKDPSTHQDTTYISTDIFGFLVDAVNLAAGGAPTTAMFAGNVFNITPPTAPTSTSSN